MVSWLSPARENGQVTSNARIGEKKQLFSPLAYLQPQYTEFANLPCDFEGNCVPLMPILSEE